MRFLLSLLLAPGLPACGSSDAASPDARPPEADAAPDARAPGVVDYDAGTWQSQVTAETAGTISHDPAGVFTSDGTLWATWMEPDVDATSGEDIWEMRLPRGGTWMLARLTDDGAAQAAANQLATDGTTVHVAYNSRTGPDNDIFYSKHAGPDWAARIDATAGESSARHDFQPDLALAPDGDAVIAYVSASVRSNGGFNPDGEIRVVRISASGEVSAPQLVIPTVAPHGCYDPTVVVDADGAVHVAADCGTVGAAEVLYTAGTGGAFSTPVPFPGGMARDDRGAKLALGPDGRTLHAIWTTDDGDTECTYSRKVPGAPWAAAVSASNAPTAKDHACVLTVDPGGTVLAAWHRANDANAEDIYFAWSGDGATFHTPRVVTPDTATTTEWFPGMIAVEPETGAVHILYERIVPMTDPLNTQIMHAQLTAPASPP